MALPIALMQMSINGGKKKTGLLLGPAIIVCRDASNRIHTDWVNGMQSNPLRRIDGEFSMAHIQGVAKNNVDFSLRTLYRPCCRACMPYLLHTGK